MNKNLEETVVNLKEYLENPEVVITDEQREILDSAVTVLEQLRQEDKNVS